MNKLIVVACVLLAGCAGPGALIVDADLNKASAMANETGDKEGAACFDALKKANTSGLAGIFTMLEQLRILRAARVPCATILLP